MKKSPLQPLLDQVELIYRSEKQIALYFRELQSNGAEGFILNSVSRDIEENKTHCERLEGLIEIIQTNLHRKLPSSEAEKFIAYCSELLHRFEYKHAYYNYQNVTKVPELTPIHDDDDDVLVAVKPKALCLQ